MQNEFKGFCKSQKQLLKNLAGATLEYIDAVLADDVNTAWNTVRVHTSSGSVDVNCLLEELAINNDGDTDEFGIISVREADASLLKVDTISTDTTSIEIGKIIANVGFITNTLDSFYNNEQLVHRENVQAVFFELNDGSFLILDREVWFEEALTIKQGMILDELIYDDSESWEDDPDDPRTRFEYTTRVERLL